MKYDWEKVDALKSKGYNQKQIAEQLGYNYSSYRIAYYRRKQRVSNRKVTNNVTKNVTITYNQFINWIAKNQDKPYAEMVFNRLEKTKKDKSLGLAIFELLKQMI